MHYFEIIASEHLYGSLVMVGVGTANTSLHEANFNYVNLIGNDANSWGLSHKGTKWHNGQNEDYCEPYNDKFTTIGVLLDLHKKQLSFYKNGVSLGVAFKLVSFDSFC